MIFLVNFILGQEISKCLAANMFLVRNKEIIHNNVPVTSNRYFNSKTPVYLVLSSRMIYLIKD